MSIKRRGTAVVIALVFAILLLQMGVIYTSILRTSKTQTSRIDERSRVEFLANGLIELALLKFRFLPSDFYASYDAALSPTIPAANRSNEYLRSFIDDPVFTIKEQVEDSLLGNVEYNAQISEMILHTVATGTRWGVQALEIRATVAFTGPDAENVTRTVTKVYRVDRSSTAPVN
ncbi:MAG TPA: hypothetical protein DCG57_07280 [Candidatus Riflebacteria bacterium]|jgi:hypothetical protein|nr:hypothetical protein [Candidatus Riflebacteria bacterium]